MDEKEINEKLSELQKKLDASATESAKKEIEKQIAELKEKSGYISKADVTVMLDERDKQKQKDLDEMSAQIKQFKANGLPTNGKVSIASAIEKSLEGKVSYIDESTGKVKQLEATVKDTMLEMKNGNQKATARFVIKMTEKANTDPITITDSYTGGTIGLTDFMTGYTTIPQYRPFLRQIVNTMRTSKTYIGWWEQLAIEGDAGMVAEGAVKPQNSFTSIERQERIKKIAKWTKTSKENLDDLPLMNGIIRDELTSAVLRKLDSQLLEGDNTGENLKGILEYAPDFNIAGTPLVNTIVNANNYDALRVAAAQILVNSKDNFVPNYFIIHPWAAAAMDLAKADDGVYVVPPFTTVDGRRIAGMIGVENSRVGVDSFLVGDFTKSHLVIREDLIVQMGYEGTDFIDNLVSILAEMRALHFIKANEVTAFVQGDFSFAKGQLDPDAVSA